MAAKKRSNGEGSIYRRKDGRWVGAVYAATDKGTRKRTSVYGWSRQEVHAKLTEEQAKAQAGIPTPDRAWRLDAYLDYWLETVVRRVRRPTTYALYETIARLYLKPGLGKQRLTGLTVPVVQGFVNKRLEAGDSVSKVETMRKVLSSALTWAMREELVTRNVSQLVILPSGSNRREVSSWSADEARRFLHAAEDSQMYPAFLLLVLYGLRRGEVLALRWCDVDFDVGLIRVRQQIQRVHGELLIGPTKTQAGRRDLPLVEIARTPLLGLRKRQETLQEGDLVFRTSTGRPIEPRNLVRSFASICDHANLRRIRVHDTRRTAATLLSKLGVPPRDTQLILGHSRISITQEIYTDVDQESKAIALDRMQALLDGKR